MTIPSDLEQVLANRNPRLLAQVQQVISEASSVETFRALDEGQKARLAVVQAKLKDKNLSPNERAVLARESLELRGLHNLLNCETKPVP